MKVLFVTPPMGNWSTWGKHSSTNPSHAQLAAFLRERGGVEVEALDCKVLELDDDAMIERIRQSRPDAVYLGNVVTTAGGAAIIARFNGAMERIKREIPRTITIAGGLMYSALPEESLKECAAIDYLIVGEGEVTLLELTQALGREHSRLREIQGLAFRENGQFLLNAPRPLIPDLDALPMPAYDLFPMEKYVGYDSMAHYNETVTSRGCMGGCNFCYQWWLYDPRRPKDFISYRTRSGMKVADEVELLHRQYGVQVMSFFDDDFSCRREKVVEFCQELLRRKIEISWFFMGRADNYVRDIDLFPLLRQAGCYMVLVGIEGSNDEELRGMGKGITVSQIKTAVSSLRENGIATVGTYIIGFWEDDAEKIQRRAGFVEEVDPDILSLQVLNPSPGSPVWHDAHKKRIIEVDDLSLWDQHHAVMPTQYLSRKEVGQLAAEINQHFFTHPKRIERLNRGDYSPYAEMLIRCYFEHAASFAAASAQDQVFV